MRGLWRPGATVQSARFGAAGPVVVLRPRKVLIFAWVGAVVTVGFFTVIALLLRASPTGVYFRVADQIAMIVMGLLVAAGVLLLARPRVRADAAHIEVRNIVTSHFLRWDEVVRVAFPDSASFARLDLPADEYISVLAIQSTDGQRAVDAMRRLRELHAASREV